MIFRLVQSILSNTGIEPGTLFVISPSQAEDLRGIEALFAWSNWGFDVCGAFQPSWPVQDLFRNFLGVAKISTLRDDVVCLHGDGFSQNPQNRLTGKRLA
jgi:hypothetical protein